MTANSFIDSINNCKVISAEDKDASDYNISNVEVLKAIDTLKNNKSPGCDGITSEFYKMFDKELSPFLLNVFSESIHSEALPTNLTQGIIPLIPKPNKDKENLENWRPITSLNNDYKVLAIIFANRMKYVLDFIHNYVFSKVGGLEFLLMCNYKISKIQIKLSNFHKQMLLAWSLIFKHNFSPHKCYIWNNENILYKNKSLSF